MSAPLLADNAPLLQTLPAALTIGVAFGFVLEQAGLGSARKLVGQFYGRDFAVLKVMFSALLVAMLGVFWLGRSGWLDVDALYVPQTFLTPQLIGGVLFGAGLVVAGLCPGTACVSAATGRIDGLCVLLGLFVGMVGVGLLLTQWSRLYDSTARGAWTLPECFGLSPGVVIFAVVVLALVAFAVCERIQRREP